MIPLIALFLGGALSLVLVSLARTYSPRRERHIYGVGLVIASLIYVSFGVAGGASAQWLAFE